MQHHLLLARLNMSEKYVHPWLIYSWAIENLPFRKHIKCWTFTVHAICICIAVADFISRVNAKQISGIEVGDVLPLLNKAPDRQDVWEWGGTFPPIFGAFRKIAKRLILASSCLSVRPSAWKNAAPTGRVFMKFDFCGFFENLSRKFKFY